MIKARLSTLSVSLAVWHLVTSSALAGSILFVDPNASGPTHDGKSWCTAFTDLHEALDVALPGETIHVSDGEYVPNSFGLANPREASFHLINNVAIVGGFAGCGAADPDERDISAFRSILSGDQAGDDLDGFINVNENSYHVVIGDGTTSSAVLDGFIIEHGNADDDIIPHNAGGGMRTSAGSPTLTDCIFQNNIAVFGGGMENFNGANPVMTRCTFIGNHATFRGGGMHNNTSRPSLIDCMFIGNTAVNSSGGARNWDNSNATYTRCVFLNNHADFGGGMVNDDSNPILESCIFRSNTALDTSGGLHNWRSAPLLINCLFHNNSATNRGGGMFNLNNSVVSMINCTFAGNSAFDSGGAVYQRASASMTASNCVLWGNPGGTIGGPGAAVVTYTNIEGGWVGSGNIDQDPLFVDDFAGDLRLRLGSPCIDAGNNTVITVPQDLDGLPRLVDEPCTPDTGIGPAPVVDLGAYEFQGGTECCATIDCDPNALCTDLVDGPVCSCLMGFEGNGMTCSDIDECSLGTADCDVKATCTNTDGSFVCTCDPGFSGDGKNCVDIDECAEGSHDCHPFATCHNGVGSFSCVCDPGYIGNGISCATNCGDGAIVGVEECDDGGTAGGDGCSTDCTVEEGFTCEKEPSECAATDSGVVPALSDWGLIVLLLLLLTAAKLRFRSLCRSPLDSSLGLPFVVSL